jgi:inorganic pyrophosphatase
MKTHETQNGWNSKTRAAFKPVTISVTIETPRGSRNKLKYEPAKNLYSLSKILPDGMVFPYDFGFVPGTKAEDGDPLDVPVLTDEPLFPGCLVACTLVGVIELRQEESRKPPVNHTTPLRHQQQKMSKLIWGHCVFPNGIRPEPIAM